MTNDGEFKVGDELKLVPAMAHEVITHWNSYWRQERGDLNSIYVTEVRSGDLRISNKPDEAGPYWEPRYFMAAWTPKVGERVRVTYGGWEGEGAVYDVGASYSYVKMETGTQSGQRGGFAIQTDIEPLPALRIEAGRYYRTRDGRKVGPMKRWNDLEGRPYNDRLLEVEGDGRYWSLDGKGHSAQDLIALWEEPAAATPLTAATVDYQAEEYGPVVPVAGASSAEKFKVGDKVVALVDWLDVKAGETYTITNVEGDGAHLLLDECGDPWCWMEASELKLAQPTAIVALIEDGQPKPASRSYVYATTEAAQAEAQRMANVHKGQAFGVYVLTGEPVKVKPPVYAYEWQRLAIDESSLIPAIKELRSVSGIGLKAAKDAVEDWKSRQPRSVIDWLAAA